MSETLAYLLIGALMGVVGQTLRVIVGIKKEFEAAKPLNLAAKDWFNGKELVITILLGAAAGVLAAVSKFDLATPLSKEILMAFVAAGYAGSDFISGFMGKWLK